MHWSHLLLTKTMPHWRDCLWFLIHFLQFSSVTQLCLTLCDLMNCSTSGLPVYHQLLEFTQTHVHWLGDAIQPPHPLSSPSPPAFNHSQHQGLSQHRHYGGKHLAKTGPYTPLKIYYTEQFTKCFMTRLVLHKITALPLLRTLSHICE